MCELALAIEKEPSTYAKMDDNDFIVVDSGTNEGCIRKNLI